jgi:hypothetical protein
MARRFCLAWRGLQVAIPVDIHQVMVGFMGVAADDLKCSQVSELRMADRGFSWCLSGGPGPFSCRCRQDDQADGWRELRVVANFREGVLIPACNAPAGIVSEGEQPLGPNPQVIYQMPHIHRGRPAHADLLHRLVDAADGRRRDLGELSYQVNGVIARDSPGEAALLTHGAVRLPSHGGRLSDLRASRCEEGRFAQRVSLPVRRRIRLPGRAFGNRCRRWPASGPGRLRAAERVSSPRAWSMRARVSSGPGTCTTGAFHSLLSCRAWCCYAGP